MTSRQGASFWHFHCLKFYFLTIIMVLGIEPGVLCMLGKHSTTKVHSLPGESSNTFVEHADTDNDNIRFLYWHILIELIV